jgi:hypothetical protein
MKIIDKTPLLNPKGELGLVQRLQGAMQYGPAWQAELEAQKVVIEQLDRVLEKGFTLIRNLNLARSQITEPLIIVGPPGLFVLYVTPASGHFEAKGDEWNTTMNDRRVPAQVNLLKRVARLARALQVYLNRQGMTLPGMVEPVLVASNPSVHIDILRPIVRVVMSDAIKQFGASLMQARPVLKSDTVHEFVDHILNPRPKELSLRPEMERPALAPEPEQPSSAAEPQYPASASEQESQSPSRARAIFQAAEEAKPFNPADLDFQFDENASAGVPARLKETSPSQKLAPIARRRGINRRQWVLLGILALVELGILASFAALIFLNSR